VGSRGQIDRPSHAHLLVCRQPPRPVETAFTISLDEPNVMADAARSASRRPVLKIKLGGPNDFTAMHAVVAAAPRSRIIIDANEAWSPDDLPELMREATRLHIALIEQPLPVGQDEILPKCRIRCRSAPTKARTPQKIWNRCGRAMTRSTSSSTRPAA
jgi:L-alanine-DL-glutamate epimerase-like enolase superfamily enzyme